MGTSHYKSQKDLLKLYSIELFQEHAKVQPYRKGRPKDLSCDIHYNPSAPDPEARRSPIQLGYIIAHLGAGTLSAGEGLLGLTLSRAWI